jgi:hypothetical protein
MLWVECLDRFEGNIVAWYQLWENTPSQIEYEGKNDKMSKIDWRSTPLLSSYQLELLLLHWDGFSAR